MGRETIYTGVRRASETTIEIRFRYKGKNCKERIRLKPSTANLKRAFAHRQQIIDSIEAGTFDYSTTFPNSKNALKFEENKLETVETYFINWLKNEKLTKKASTYKLYLNIVNNVLIPYFGQLTLDKVTRKMVRDFVNLQTCGNKRMNNVLIPLRRILQEAYNDELISSNPLKDFKYKKNEAVKTLVDPFTIEEIEKILSHLKGQNKNIINFAVWTGLRPSEYIALNWSDIDFVHGYIYVSKVLTDDSLDFEKPKTASGLRKVKILDPAMDILNDQKQYSFLKGEEIFQNFKGERFKNPSQVYNTAWKHPLRKSGVRKREMYQLRHTFASRLISSGENIMWVSKQMGHSSWAMTANKYARWMDEANEHAGNKAVKKFDNKCGKNVANS